VGGTNIRNFERGRSEHDENLRTTQREKNKRKGLGEEGGFGEGQERESRIATGRKVMKGT